MAYQLSEEISILDKQLEEFEIRAKELGHRFYPHDKQKCSFVVKDLEVKMKLLHHKASIFLHCKNCGNEFYKEWEYGDVLFFPTRLIRYEDEGEKLGREWEKIEKKYFAILGSEINEMQTLQKCPYCNGKLSQDKGYYLAFTDYDKIKTVLKEKNMERVHEKKISTVTLCRNSSIVSNIMSNERQKAEQKYVNDKVCDFISSFDFPVQTKISFGDIELIKNTSEKLKEYIYNLFKLETNIFGMKKRLLELYSQSIICDRRVVLVQNIGYELQLEVDKLEEAYNQCVEKNEQYKTKGMGLTIPVQPQEPLYKTPGLFNKKKILKENEVLKEKYQRDMEEYSENIRRYEEEKKSRLEMIQEEIENARQALEDGKLKVDESRKNAHTLDFPEMKVKNFVDEEIKQTEDILQRLYKCRNEMYGYNIIFEKYRNMVALATFYEYLMAGRCTELEGTNGAYNIYEAETRSNIIIGQLTQVIEKLEDIKEGQYLICSEVQNVNKNLEKLNFTMDKALESIQNIEDNTERIVENTEVIAHNTAVTAYYSKVNAELTNAMGFMMALK